MNDKTKITELLNEAWTRRREGKYDEAFSLVGEAHEICSEDDFNMLGRIHHLYRQFESDQNNYDQALKWSRKSLEYYQKTGDGIKIAHAMRHLADLQRQLGMDNEAEKNYQEAIALYKNNPDTQQTALANAFRGFSLLLEKRGKTQEAISSWRETKALYQSSELQAGVDEANERLEALA